MRDFVTPGAWITVDGALVRRDVTSVDIWVEWRSHVEKLIADHEKYGPISSMRLGQMIINALEGYGRIDIKFRTSGALCDPFHNDENIPAFIQLVDETWEIYGTN